MTPVTYDFLQSNGFKLLIPIVSQNAKPRDEALAMWGKELDGKMIRLEHHKNHPETPSKHDPSQQAKEDLAPFQPEGLKLFIGEKQSLELQFEATIYYVEELEPFLEPTEQE